MKRLAAVALLVALLLSGCSSAKDKGDELSALEVPEATVDAGSGNGALAGVVVDEAIRPIPQADVRAEGQFNVTTDAEGRFVVEDLAPGLYLLHVTAPGFFAMQTGAEVKAGDATPIRLQLSRDTTPQPRHHTEHFQGHIDLWLGQKTVEDNAPGTLNCICTFEFVPEETVRTWVVEAKGTVTLENPEPVPELVPARGTVSYTLQSAEGVKSSAYHSLPFSVHVEGEVFDNSTGPYMVRLTGSNWPSGKIDYDLYVTAFYVAPAPEEWSFLAGDP